MTFGATLRDLVVPLPVVATRRVVLGFETLEGYLENNRFLGVTVGRHASRIGRGRLAIDGTRHQLIAQYGGRRHLHGGAVGFSRRPWTILEADEASVTLASPRRTATTAIRARSRCAAPTACWSRRRSQSR